MAAISISEQIQRDSVPFDIDKSAAVISNDPAKIYEEYRYLRKECPLIHTSQYGGYWLLTRYDDVKRAAMDSETYISSVRAVVPSDPRGIRRPPLNFDAPAHTPFRTALERTVKPARLRRLREPLQKHAEAELAPLLARGRGDLSAEFAANFVARMESEWLNLEPDVAPKLAVTAASWLNAWRMQDGETVTANSQKMYQIAQELLADRRLHPRDPEEDPASSLLLERDAEGHPLKEEHLIGCLRQSLVVGVVAPPILIGSICHHLSKDKELQKKLREDESLIPAALEEFLRLYSPYRGFARTTSKEVCLHGKTIHPKEPITLCYTAANRDPEVFENPDEFVLHRENIASHMGFGRGRHRCAGMPLARLALDIVVRVILRSTKDFDVDADGMTWDQSMPGLIPSAYQPQDVQSAGLSSTADGDELALAEDGHRAVQTINGILTNTLFNVTSHVELSDLTPRFLDSSLHMFFTKFVPILPIIHRPTFVYRDCSAPLLLNAIALGSLFLGTEDATGEALWRLAYTAIATSWPEMTGHKREHDACSGVELVLTALLSQIYAALSRNRTLRMTSQTFYGLSMHWAQYCGMYDLVPYRQALPQTHDSIETKMHAWRSWAARETQLRTLLGLCIIDGVVSQFSGNLVNTWSATNSLPLSADADAFAAETVDEWIEVMVSRGHNTGSGPDRFSDLYHSLVPDGTHIGPVYCLPGLLNIRILLEILASLTNDFERLNKGSQAQVAQKLGAVKALVTLRTHLAQSTTLSPADKTIGLLRWHAVCLDLVVSTARGARRMCYHYNITQHIFGGKKREEPSRIDPNAWTQGLRARKCLLHAMEIHKIASEIPLGIIHDTCLPGALFAAATTFSSFALPGLSKVLVPPSVDWGMVILQGLDDTGQNTTSSTPDVSNDTLAFLTNNVNPQSPGWIARNLVYELSAIRILLHSLSQHWGVTREMEEVVGAWEARCS
ncbi:C2H2 type zinc finger domain protein [Colletotrichum camelliae]|nr:C2H2 type zinc finger domain protein [Colletotrichum camelliae]